ncbi:MAPEG family protein [Sandarakinorhabdus rubra]|uniref:MAPEG family protein n=1 Tax=Sandarakinorhabdus rubra TaxID=2672568 RepID=UPI0013DD865C|nr:MAPEG family protein [Sandarakinorhabdus rubra]
MPATLITAGLLGLVFLALTVRVVARRATGKIMIGDGGDAQMLERIRAHGNFIEHVPLALILMGGIEFTTGHGSPWLWGTGGLLVLARIAHAIGMSRPAPNPFRAAGALVTWVLIAGLSLWALWLGLVPPPAPDDFV